MKEIKQVLSNSPVNKTAQRVLSKGINYEPDINIVRFHSDVPIPLKPFYGKLKDNLKGVNFGRFTVIGFLGKKNNDNRNPGKWLVRCCCGKYEIRSTKAIKNLKNKGTAGTGDCCRECETIENMKLREFKRNYGYDS